MNTLGFVNNLKIAQKMMLTLSLTVGLAVAFTAAILNHYVKQKHDELFAQRSLVVADMLSHATLASVAFMDKKQAIEELNVLRSRSDIRYGCLYNNQLRKVLAEYYAEGEEGYTCGPFAGEDYYQSTPQDISIYKNLSRNGIEVGGLYLVINNHEQKEQRKTMVVILFSASLISCFLALLLTSKMSAALYRPIQNLDRTSQNIARLKDWSLRAEKQSEDELGALVDTFNEMVTIIEKDQHELERLAYYDALTKIPNRRLLEQKVISALARAKRLKKQVAIIFIDLDDFKWVNDSLGHDQGDVLLRTIAERISGCMRLEDTLARFGGDEFVILAEMIGSPDEVDTICERVLGSLKEAIFLEAMNYKAKVSLGAVCADPHDAEIYELMKKADIALYHAKRMGKNQYQIYYDGMEAV